MMTIKYIELLQPSQHLHVLFIRLGPGQLCSAAQLETVISMRGITPVNSKTLLISIRHGDRNDVNLGRFCQVRGVEA